jgi:hypothetical protein
LNYNDFGEKIKPRGWDLNTESLGFSIIKTCFECYRGRLKSERTLNLLLTARSWSEKDFAYGEISEKSFLRMAALLDDLMNLCRNCKKEKKLFRKLYRRMIIEGGDLKEVSQERDATVGGNAIYLVPKNIDEEGG